MKKKKKKKKKKKEEKEKEKKKIPGIGRYPMGPTNICKFVCEFHIEGLHS